MINVDSISAESALDRSPSFESLPARFFSLMPAVVLAARYQSISISEFVAVLQQQGFGGKRSCRKLIHRLERLGLLLVGPGARGDRREKSIAPAPLARQQLRLLAEVLERF